MARKFLTSVSLSSQKITDLASGTVGADAVNKTQLDTKQDTLISGTNIKTIGGTTILGTGDISSTTPDATTIAKGVVQLAGDLGGTAALPTVPGLVSLQVGQSFYNLQQLI